MSETVIAIVAILVVAAISFGFGRRLGGRWIAIFSGLMGVGLILLIVSLLTTSNGQPGLAELMLFFFIWIPVAVSGAIGGIIGWIIRTSAKPNVRPPMP